MTVMLLLGAVVAGWIVQTVLTYRQSKTFNQAVRALRAHGTVAVGAGGKRYRGGRAFVAVAADDAGRVTRAITLAGWTTFARPAEIRAVAGMKLSRLRGNEPIPAVGTSTRLALAEAATTVSKHLKNRSTATTAA